jgi:hypothetical protein
VTIKVTIFCDVRPCSPVRIHRRFGGRYYLNLHCRKTSQSRNQQEGRSCLSLVFWLIYSRTLKKEARLHGVTSQNTVLFNRKHVTIHMWSADRYNNRCRRPELYWGHITLKTLVQAVRWEPTVLMFFGGSGGLVMVSHHDTAERVALISLLVYTISH